jgi:predicted metal-dependent peptidase
MAVDAGWRLYYDPVALASWKVDEVSGVVYHEVCHLLRAHADRSSFADRKDLWNVVADAEINDDLKAEGVSLPGEPVYPRSFGQPAGKLAEEYYAVLQRHQLPPAPDGPAAGACRGAATGELLDGVERLVTALELAGAERHSWRIPPAIEAGEQEVIRRRVARDIDEHQKFAGTVPCHLARWAAEHLEPRVDWRRELAALVRWGLAEASGMVDYSYGRPSRRQGRVGRVILPSLRRPVPRVAVVVDTSGSMTDAMLAVAVAEIRGILAAAGLREGVAVLSVDAAVKAHQRVARAESVWLEGGGGTDMGVGLAAVERTTPRPEIVVIITDGFTPWPERPPRGIRTIVVRTDARGTSPSWAHAVTVPPEAVPKQNMRSA